MNAYLIDRNGIYHCVIDYTDENGKRKQKSYTTGLPVKGNKKRAEAILKEKVKNFVPPIAAAPKDPGEKTFVDLLNDWLRFKKTQLRPTTYGTYQEIVKNKLIPYFEPMNLTVKEVKAVTLQEYYLRESERVAARTVIHEHNVIHGAFEYAIKMDLVEYNPADKATPPRPERTAIEPYTEQELAELLEKTKDDDLSLIILIAATYGLRRGEVLGIRWSAIDFDKNTLQINHVVTETCIDGKHVIITQDTPKTKSGFRSFPLTSAVRERLLDWREIQQKNRKFCGNSYNKEYLDYVFTNALGDIIKPNYIECTFPKLLKKYGLRRIRFHDLRHTCATLLHSQKVPIKSVQEFLGHSDISTTANIYVHLDWDDKEETVKVIEDTIAVPEYEKKKSPWEN